VLPTRMAPAFPTPPAALISGAAVCAEHITSCHWVLLLRAGQGEGRGLWLGALRAGAATSTV
jgi:hypothetical protein